MPEAIVNTAKFPQAQLIQLLQQARCMLVLSSDLRPTLRLQRRGKSVALLMMTVCEDDRFFNGRGVARDSSFGRERPLGRQKRVFV